MTLIAAGQTWNTPKITEQAVKTNFTYARETWLDESSYYLNVSVNKSPTTGVVLAVFSQWSNAGHTWSETSKTCFRKSTDDGVTWTSKATAYDPAGTRGVIDLGGGYDSNGVWHGFTNSSDGSGTTPTQGTSQLHYLTTSDDGENWTVTEITPPSDGLTFNVGYGDLVELDGYLIFSTYRQTDDASSSARYILKKPLVGGLWTWVLVESGSTYINEWSIAKVGPTSMVGLARNESTKEWTQYFTSDTGETWVNQGPVTFGLNLTTTAGPARLKASHINGTSVIFCYYPNRETAILFRVLAKAGDFATLGTSAWNLSTVTTIVDDTELIHYGDVVHYNNDYNGRMIYTREVVSSVLSTLIYSNLPSLEYHRDKTALGL